MTFCQRNIQIESEKILAISQLFWRKQLLRDKSCQFEESDKKLIRLVAASSVNTKLGRDKNRKSR